MLPLSWTNRRVRFEYVDASGIGQTASGTLLDYYPAGCVFAMNGGARTLIVWERLCLLELVE